MASLKEKLALNVMAVTTMRRIGLLKPSVLRTTVKATAKWGPSLAMGFSASAQRRPDAIGVIDEDGPVTFGDLDRMSNALANVLRARGIGARTPVALLSRNSRWFIVANVALDKVGATVLYMNTGFAGPQLADVMVREGAELLIHDDEFTAAVAEHAPAVAHVIADVPTAARDGVDDVPTLIEKADTTEPSKPEQFGKTVILTSGTTGVPKGAARDKEGAASDLAAATALFERIPFKVNDIQAIPAPWFHSLGAASLAAAGLMSATVVAQRRFDPETLLAALVEHDVRNLTVVPVMLQRILALPDETLDKYRPRALEIVFSSGSALPGSLAIEWMDRFGDNLYNMYGSTEVSAATVAVPADMRAAPGTAGRPLSGVDVRIYDDNDTPITAPEVTGRIFVGSTLRFDGYTGGQTKASIDGLLSSGDLGYWDHDGRVFVGGRDDDMIVSGGENLFPREVEDVVSDMPGIREVSIIGVDDAEFGKRLAAFVVLDDGVSLKDGDIKDHVKKNLANFKSPRDVVFLDELPRNATGKVLKRELRAMLDNG